MDSPGKSVDDIVRQVGDALSRLPDPSSLQTQQEFMEAGVEAMDSLLTLGKITVCLQRPSGRGYTKRHAPIVGLMVRMVKLFEGILDQVVKRRSELAEVFVRPFFEAHIKFEYLIRSGRKSAQSFIKTSFRSEKEMLSYLNQIKKARSLLPIETRIRKSILNHLDLADMTQAELLSQKTWDIDGKSMRALLRDLKKDLHYAFGFGSSSHAVHGTWYDVWVHHLQKVDGRYYAEVRYGSADPKYLTSPTIFLCDSLLLFLSYFRLDKMHILHEQIETIEDYIRAFSAVWEERLAQQSNAT